MKDYTLIKSAEVIVGEEKFMVCIHFDEPYSPRKYDGHVGKMICFHTGYKLGDEHDYKMKDVDYNPDRMLKKILSDYKTTIYYPLYLYDHSGITMNTTGFSCRWDSGQVGWIVLDRDNVKKWGCKLNYKYLKQSLINEVEEYDQFLRGDVYGYKIYKMESDDDDTDLLDLYDSCWGFYGMKYVESEAISALGLKKDEKIEWINR